MTTIELTIFQEQFLVDLSVVGTLTISMVQIQEKYANIASKASIKRNVNALVSDGIIKRHHFKIIHNGKITSTTIYQI